MVVQCQSSDPRASKACETVPALASPFNGPLNAVLHRLGQPARPGTREALHIAAMHRRSRRPRSDEFLCMCMRVCMRALVVLAGCRGGVLVLWSAVARVWDAMHRARPSRKCAWMGGGNAITRQRGKQKAERKTCDGKLTGEAGPALRAVVHGGYVDAGASRNRLRRSAGRDQQVNAILTGG